MTLTRPLSVIVAPAWIIRARSLRTSHHVNGEDDAEVEEEEEEEEEAAAVSSSDEDVVDGGEVHPPDPYTSPSAVILWSSVIPVAT